MNRLFKLLVFAKLTGLAFITSGCDGMISPSVKASQPTEPSAAAVALYEAEFAAQVEADAKTHEKLDGIDAKLDAKVDTLAADIQEIRDSIAQIGDALDPSDEPAEPVQETPKPPQEAAPDVVSQPSSTPARSEQDDASSVRPVTIDGQVFELEAFVDKWYSKKYRLTGGNPDLSDQENLVNYLVKRGVSREDIANLEMPDLVRLHSAVEEYQRSQSPMAAAPKQPTYNGNSGSTDARTFTRQWYRGGAYWTHPGSITSHLQGTHGVDPSVLAGMSKAEQEAYHSALHEQGTAVKSRSVTRQYAVKQYASSSDCPSGNCPTNSGYQYRTGLFGRRAARRGW